MARHCGLIGSGLAGETLVDVGCTGRARERFSCRLILTDTLRMEELTAHTLTPQLQ